MDLAELRPKIRFLEPHPLEHEGQRLIILHDPSRLTENTLAVSIPAYIIATMMNGDLTVEEIRSTFNRLNNASITMDDMRQVVTALDDALFLDNEDFRNHRNTMMQDFARSPVRRSCLAGRSYTENPRDLSAMLNSFFDGHPVPSKAPLAIIAPHIDLVAGGRVFGAAYSQLKNSKAETFVILAIGHSLSGDFFSCIDKDFETPLGKSEVDRPFLEKLEEDFGEPVFNEMFAHKFEHSAEFQVLFLQHLFGNESPPRKIVPILFSFPEYIDEMDDPRLNPERLKRFTDALRKGVERMGDKVCLIAGVDLSHVGRRFGQTEGATDDVLERVEREDRDILSLAEELNRPGFASVMREMNYRNNICGFPAMYVLLDLLEGCEGKLLDYGQNVEGENDSMVSFAAMAFTR